MTASMVAAGSLRLSSITVDGANVYWIEGRPTEGGRMTLVKRDAGGRITDVTPPHVNVRSRVHEYGGAAYRVLDRVAYFVEFKDQRVYRLRPGEQPEPLTAESDGRIFYADFAVDRWRRRVIGVREDHRGHPHGVVNTIVSVAETGDLTHGDVIVSGHDFYATPRLSPDGTRLSWLAWRHPQMPWDGTELWLGDIASDGSIRDPRQIAGGSEESIFQPGWTSDGELFFVSDRTGWWNLYRWTGKGAESVHALDAEFGRAQWQFGASTWASDAAGRKLVVSYGRRGYWHLATIDRSTGEFDDVPCGVEPGDTIAMLGDRIVTLGGSARTPDTVVLIDPVTGTVSPLRASSDLHLDHHRVSVPKAIEYPSGGTMAHAFFYPPHNEDFVPMDDERPPLVVFCHGGPTASTYARLSLEIQFFTSRGLAVIDVNHGGSAGYGRAYRERLRGLWGIVDVDDCVGAATFLADHGHVDRKRMVIRGRSAGGYTTLAALAFRPGVFRGGASYYGIGDLERLALETHKFEQHYLDGLIGPYPAAADLYRARSPLFHADRITSPLILLQGLEDAVVPPNQATLMAEAVRTQGHQAVLVTFAGEQHGFRKAESIVRALEEELRFYRDVLGIDVRSEA